MKLKFLLFVALVFCTKMGVAQETHFTLFDMSPMTLNPAQTGAFFGTARIGGLYRNQGFAISNLKDYNTPSIYVDAPIMRGFRKQDWVGVGGAFIRDQVGVLKLVNTYSKLAASYHLGLDKKGTSVLTLGIQGGGVSRKGLNVGKDGGLFLEEFVAIANGGGGLNTSLDDVITALDENAPSGGSGNKKGGKSFSDYAAGLMFKTKFDKESSFEIGFMAGHLTRPKYAFKQTGGEDAYRKPLRFGAHAKMSMPLNESWSIEPTLYYQSLGKANEILVQGWAGYKVNPTTKINFGLGYRVGDALNVLFGAQIKDIKVALAYDVTISSKSSINNGNGAVEFAAYYILKKYKKPDVKPKILCPRL